MSKVVVSVFTEKRKLHAFRVLLDRICPHPVADLTFVQQSHNATVFKGNLDGSPAFFKCYENGNAANWVQACVDETQAASARMAQYRGGVADLLWSSVPEGVIATKAVPGTPVTFALDGADCNAMLVEVGHWLYAYVGDTAFDDRFSTSYWVKRRRNIDLDGLNPADTQLALSLLDLQAKRAKRLGTVPCVKGETPRDFTPWNLHWAADTIWGFDLEGHVVKSLAHVIARFCVLAVEQSDGRVGAGDVPLAVSQLRTAFQGQVDPPELITYVVGDVLFERFVKWAGHGTIQPKLRHSVQAHLTEG